MFLIIYLCNGKEGRKRRRGKGGCNGKEDRIVGRGGRRGGEGGRRRGGCNVKKGRRRR